MALQDDVNRLVMIDAARAVLSGQARQLRQAAGLSLSEVGKACGTTASVIGMWEDSLARPTVQQALAWQTLLLDRAIARTGSYATVIRQTAPPVEAETTAEGALTAAAELHKRFPSWRIKPDGLESPDSGKTKFIWRAQHAGDWPPVAAATAAELAGKLERIEAGLAADERLQEQYRSGRGVSRR